MLYIVLVLIQLCFSFQTWAFNDESDTEDGMSSRHQALVSEEVFKSSEKHITSSSRKPKLRRKKIRLVREADSDNEENKSEASEASAALDREVEGDIWEVKSKTPDLLMSDAQKESRAASEHKFEESPQEIDRQKEKTKRKKDKEELVSEEELDEAWFSENEKTLEHSPRSIISGESTDEGEEAGEDASEHSEILERISGYINAHHEFLHQKLKALKADGKKPVLLRRYLEDTIGIKFPNQKSAYKKIDKILKRTTSEKKNPSTFPESLRQNKESILDEIRKKIEEAYRTGERYQPRDVAQPIFERQGFKGKMTHQHLEHFNLFLRSNGIWDDFKLPLIQDVFRENSAAVEALIRDYYEREKENHKSFVKGLITALENFAQQNSENIFTHKFTSPNSGRHYVENSLKDLKLELPTARKKKPMEGTMSMEDFLKEPDNLTFIRATILKLAPDMVDPNITRISVGEKFEKEVSAHLKAPCKFPTREAGLKRVTILFQRHVIQEDPKNFRLK